MTRTRRPCLKEVNQFQAPYVSSGEGRIVYAKRPRRLICLKTKRSIETFETEAYTTRDVETRICCWNLQCNI